jgi:hypothetical protein
MPLRLVRARYISPTAASSTKNKDRRHACGISQTVDDGTSIQYSLLVYACRTIFVFLLLAAVVLLYYPFTNGRSITRLDDVRAAGGISVYRKDLTSSSNLTTGPAAYTPRVQTRDAFKVSARSIYKPHSRE